ncbi:MAG: N-acetylneuraminate synthase family protein [Treponema sp.]|jgi:sialic acid synthase SpsE|nr:N-acetylneuraminate synthase family protein [Treponema sp.]
MGQDFTIDGQRYHAGRVLIIAELGTSHRSDIHRAKEMVDAAAESGALCVKLQMVCADEILHPRTGAVPLPGGLIPLYDVFKRLEAGLDFYLAVKEHVESRGLLFLCTPFGPQSAEALYSLGPKALKIASPELNYTALVQQIAAYKLPVFLSCGVSTLGDIEEALAALSPDGAGGPVCLLHCVTAYPAPEQDYNLRLLRNLQGIFGVPLGVSDHSLDWELVPCLAAAMGAAAVEKHFCLSPADQGLDDPIALPPDAFSRMVKAVHRAETLGGEGVIARLSEERGASLVAAILGDGVKRLAASERENYTRSNRSLHALRDIAPGEILGPGMIAALRTEKLLRPGLPPSWEPKVLGRRARAFIPAGEGVRFEDL